MVTTGFTGGNILANDTLGGSAATTSNVAITQISTTTPSVNINTTNGSVIVGTGTTVGTHTVVYKICEKAHTGNCDTANVVVTINPLPYTQCMNFDTTCALACGGVEPLG